MPESLVSKVHALLRLKDGRSKSRIAGPCYRLPGIKNLIDYRETTRPLQLKRLGNQFFRNIKKLSILGSGARLKPIFYGRN
jgi:hypothetical protein